MGGAYLLFAVEQLKGWEETEGVPFYLPAQMAKCIKQLQCLEVFITSQSAAPAYSPEHHTFTPPVWEAFRVSPTKTEYYFISATSISSSRPEPFWIIPVIWNQSLCLFRIVNTSLNGVAHVPLEERSLCPPKKVFPYHIPIHCQVYPPGNSKEYYVASQNSYCSPCLKQDNAI